MEKGVVSCAEVPVGTEVRYKYDYDIDETTYLTLDNRHLVPRGAPQLIIDYSYNWEEPLFYVVKLPQTSYEDLV